MAQGDCIGKGKKFTSKNQPSAKAKSLGRQKKIFLKNIAKMIVNGELVDDLKPLAKKFGLDHNIIDVETMMHLRMVEKVIQKGDTSAYNSIMDRLKGKPHQSIDHTTKGESIKPPIQWNDE